MDKLPELPELPELPKLPEGFKNIKTDNFKLLLKNLEGQQKIQEQIKDPEFILAFLSGEGKDCYGRTYSEILQSSDQELEFCHDHIQWIFPLHERSHFALFAPVVTEEIVSKARKNLHALNNLMLACDRFKIFYGLDPVNENRQEEWCVNNNHNLYRITRIIRSLRLFGLEDSARKMYNRVVRVGNELRLPSYPIEFWVKAMYGPVWDALQVPSNRFNPLTFSEKTAEFLDGLDQVKPIVCDPKCICSPECILRNL